MAYHISPSITGHLAWELLLSGDASRWTLKNTIAFPLVGLRESLLFVQSDNILFYIRSSNKLKQKHKQKRCHYEIKVQSTSILPLTQGRGSDHPVSHLIDTKWQSPLMVRWTWVWSSSQNNYNSPLNSHVQNAEHAMACCFLKARMIAVNHTTLKKADSKPSVGRGT